MYTENRYWTMGVCVSFITLSLLIIGISYYRNTNRRNDELAYRDFQETSPTSVTLQKAFLITSIISTIGLLSGSTWLICEYKSSGEFLKGKAVIKESIGLGLAAISFMVIIGLVITVCRTYRTQLDDQVAIYSQGNAQSLNDDKKENQKAEM